MDGAAVLLGVSRRFLVDVLRNHPHCERRGNQKVFYPEHIALLREALKCPTSNSKSEKVSGTPLEPSAESAYERALALAIESERKAPPPGTNGNSDVRSQRRRNK
jgi:hypothetical protein